MREKAYAATAGYGDRALAGERLDFDTTMSYRQDFVEHIHIRYILDMQQDAMQVFYALVTDVTEQVEARRQVEILNQELASINGHQSGATREQCAPHAHQRRLR